LSWQRRFREAIVVLPLSIADAPATIDIFFPRYVESKGEKERERKKQLPRKCRVLRESRILVASFVLFVMKYIIFSYDSASKMIANVFQQLRLRVIIIHTRFLIRLCLCMADLTSNRWKRSRNSDPWPQTVIYFWRYFFLLRVYIHDSVFYRM